MQVIDTYLHLYPIEALLNCLGDSVPLRIVCERIPDPSTLCGGQVSLNTLALTHIGKSGGAVASSASIHLDPQPWRQVGVTFYLFSFIFHLLLFFFLSFIFYHGISLVSS